MKTVRSIPELVREVKDGPVAVEVEGQRYVVQAEASFERAEAERLVASLARAELDYQAGLGKTVDEVRAGLQVKHGF